MTENRTTTTTATSPDIHLRPPSSRRLSRNQRRLRGAGVAGVGLGGIDIDAWSEAIWTTALEFITRRRGLDEFAASEVAGDVVEQFLKRPSHWVSLYGHPVRFAVAVTETRYLDWLGRERRGRGQGRTTVRDADGTTRPRRRIVPLEFRNDDGEWEPHEPRSVDGDFVDTVAERVDLDRAASGLTDAQADALHRVVVEDRTTVEVGAREGVAHTTIVKRRQQAERTIASTLGEDYLGESA